MSEYKIYEKCQCCGKVGELEETLHNVYIAEDHEYCMYEIHARMLLCDDCRKKLIDKVANEFKAMVWYDFETQKHM